MDDVPRPSLGSRLRSWRGAGRWLVLALVGGLALAGGAASGFLLLVKAQTCVSWAVYETPNEAFEAAALVVSGTVAPARATRDVFGYQAAVHKVRVAQVLKGDAVEGSTVEVAATPETCGGGEVYPNGDPLDVDGTLTLFLIESESSGQWRLLSPFSGVLAGDETGASPSLDAW